MVGQQRLSEPHKAPPSGVGAANLRAGVAAPAEHAARFTAITPPWHLRHARMLIAATAVVATAGAAFVAYRVWQIYTDPFDRILAERRKAATRAAPDPGVAVPVTVPAVAAPVTVPVVPPPRLSEPVVSAVPSQSPRIPPVTHTAREAAPVAASAAAPAVADSGRCTEGVVALGLCTPSARTAGK